MKKLLLAALTALVATPAFAIPLKITELPGGVGVFVLTETEYYEKQGGQFFKGITVTVSNGTDTVWFFTDCKHGKYITTDEAKNEILTRGVVKEGSIGEMVYDHLCELR